MKTLEAVEEIRARQKESADKKKAAAMLAVRRAELVAGVITPFLDLLDDLEELGWVAREGKALRLFIPVYMKSNVVAQELKMADQRYHQTPLRIFTAGDTPEFVWFGVPVTQEMAWSRFLDYVAENFSEPK